MPELYLIDKAKLLFDIWNDLAFLEGAPVSARDAAKYLDNLVRKQPTIEPEMRHAEWDCIDDDGGVYRCSACGEEWYLEAGTPKENNMNYCPNCGAKMDGGDNNGC